MPKDRTKKKTNSRERYDASHPTRSCRLKREDDERLAQHLKSTGRSFADFVKDHLGEEKAMIKERIETLGSKKIEESKTRGLDLELYQFVLELAHWVILLCAKSPNPLEVPCPDCLFPPVLAKQRSERFMMQLLKNGDLRCPQCGLTLHNPPQLALMILVSKVAEEIQREKLLESQKGGTDNTAEIVHDSSARST